MGFWSKVKNAAKKVGKAVKKVVETVADAVTTVVNAVVETVESVVSWIGSAIGFVIGLIRSIPYVGAIIRWIMEVVKEIIWRVGLWGLGILDFLLSLIGITPEKKLRICVVVLRLPSDKPGKLDPTVTNNILTNLNNLITVYKNEANIRIVPTGPFNYSTPFNDLPTADPDWIHFRDDASASDILDVRCNGGAAKDDIKKAGSKLELIANTTCFYSIFRRLVGYGAPITIFVVRSFTDGKLGCSLGPLSDYVTTSRPGVSADPLQIAHEISHSCGLWHLDDKSNIAYPSNGRGTDMRRWQIAIVRNSRHVSYF
ncbi:MAG: hypothetical protein R2819_10340 [Allomuricauda sp.]